MLPPTPWTPPDPLPTSLRTERLLIRYPTPDDAPAMLAAVDSCRDSLHPWLPWARTFNRNLNECLATIERWRSERTRSDPPRDNFGMSIFDGATGEYVGGSGFHGLRLPLHEAEIGYWVRADRRGRGLCTELVAGLLSWGFTPQPEGWGFRRIHIACAELNIGSRRVCDKLGLRCERTAKDDRWVDTVGYCNSLGWGVLAHEWDTKARRLKPASV